MATTDRRRVFFALPLTGRAREQLLQVARANFPPDCCVPAENYHLTLAFLGELDDSAVAALCAATPEFNRDAGVVPTRLAVFQLGGFPSPDRQLAAAYVTPDHPLTALHQTLWQSLAAMGYAPDARAFRPHITLARRLSGASPLKAQALSLGVGPLTLFESRPAVGGVHYRALAAD